ncbi:MAG: LOG family protein [Cyanothece sp. SIO1E1]|nr:LOG family protein [Cyanothece sp. SIO1E1]
MTSSPLDFQSYEPLRASINELIDQLPTRKHGELIQQVLTTILKMAGGDADRLDWKILNYALQDMAGGFEIFYPYRHIRKITIFGSARISSDSPEYGMAHDFARCVTQRGFMVLTGAGGGIMEAGNQGAGLDHSFGLNIQLPFEQGANPFIEGDRKLLNFRYFFTRKLFFLRESDALALFPGGFGTQDEAFESLTLIQTGKSGPVPIVLVDHPGGDYWRSWDHYIHKHLLDKGLISPDDSSLYTITDDLEVACAAISGFYRVFHSLRYVGEKLVVRLKCELPDATIEQLNQDFSDILISGHIAKTAALPAELGDETESLPRLIMHFNQRDFGRLHQLINTINQLDSAAPALAHPEQK